MKAATDTIEQLDYSGMASKVPRIRQAELRSAHRAGADGRWREVCPAAELEQEVSAREAPGGDMRIRSAGWPARKTLEDVSFDSRPASDTIAHLSSVS